MYRSSYSSDADALKGLLVLIAVLTAIALAFFFVLIPAWHGLVQSLQLLLALKV